MVELYWPRITTFLGPNEKYSGPGVHNVPDDHEEQFRARGWEDPPSDDHETVTVEPLDPGDYTVDELETEIGERDLSAEDRTKLSELERDGKNRDTALEVIEGW